MEYRIIATDPKYRIAPFYIAPKYNERSKTFETGQSWDTDPEVAKKQKENAPLVITEEDSFPIKHNRVYHDDIEVDRIMLALIKLHPEVVAPNKASVLPGQHRFYIENKEEEAKVEISQINREFQAYNIVREMSMSDMEDFAPLVGIRAKGLSKAQIEVALLKIVKNNPDHIISAYGDPSKKARVFINSLVDNNILSIKNGKYVYGEEIIGVNIDYAIEYCKDKANSALITQWNNMIKKAGKSNKEVKETEAV